MTHLKFPSHPKYFISCDFVVAHTWTMKACLHLTENRQKDNEADKVLLGIQCLAQWWDIIWGLWTKESIWFTIRLYFVPKKKKKKNALLYSAQCVKHYTRNLTMCYFYAPFRSGFREVICQPRWWSREQLCRGAVGASWRSKDGGWVWWVQWGRRWGEARLLGDGGALGAGLSSLLVVCSCCWVQVLDAQLLRCCPVL